MDEQGPKGPEEEGQGRWGDVRVHGGLPPPPLLLSSLLVFPCTTAALNPL